MLTAVLVATILLVAAASQSAASSCKHYRAADCDARRHPQGCLAPPILITCQDGDPYCDLDRQCNGSCEVALCTIQLDQLCAPNVGLCSIDVEINGDPNAYAWGPGRRLYIRPVPAGETQSTEDFTETFNVHTLIHRRINLHCLPARADCTYPGQPTE